MSSVHPFMALTGRSAPNAQHGQEPGLVTPKSPSSIHLLRNHERQKAFVLIVGAGKASHWASLWMFAVSGEVFAVELTAVESNTGYRWGESNGKMRRLLPACAATCGISSSPTADSCQQTTSVFADFSDSVGFDRQVSRPNMEQETSEYECLLPFSTSADSLSLKVEKVLEAVCSEPSASGAREQRELIRKCIVDFIALSGRFNDIMAGDDKGHYWIEIDTTTPFQLYHRSGI